MELLEYQAKELFRQVGIPVLPSQRIDQPRDLKELAIPYPVVLKSQVYTGGRGKAGGIKFVENTIDAMATAQAIFHLPILGRYPEALLAEAKYNSDREFYLAVVLDSSTRCPLLLGSQQGGEAIESNLDQIQQVVVDQEFSPFYARRLAVKMGLQGKLIQVVSATIEKMYTLFMQYDLDLVEINPLAVSPTEELMALDGKVTVNDAALERQKSLTRLVPGLYNNGETVSHSSSAKKLNLVKMDGNIGVLCNGTGLTMATLDLIHRSRGRTAAFVNLGGEYHHSWSLISLQERIKQGLDLIRPVAGMKVIVINLLVGVVSCQQVAETIVQYLDQYPFPSRLPIVVRLVGEQFDPGQTLLASHNIAMLDNLDDAIAQAIGLAKTPRV